MYDPYYCAGRMVPYLHELGVTNVINMNRDFYVDVETDNVPGTLTKCWWLLFSLHSDRVSCVVQIMT